MRSRTLTFKSPDKVKLIALFFIVGIVFFPSVRHATASALHTTADILSSDSQ